MATNRAQVYAIEGLFVKWQYLGRTQLEELCIVFGKHKLYNQVRKWKTNKNLYKPIDFLVFNLYNKQRK